MKKHSLQLLSLMLWAGVFANHLHASGSTQGMSQREREREARRRAVYRRGGQVLNEQIATQQSPAPRVITTPQSQSSQIPSQGMSQREREREARRQAVYRRGEQVYNDPVASQVTPPIQRQEELQHQEQTRQAQEEAQGVEAERRRQEELQRQEREREALEEQRLREEAEMKHLEEVPPPSGSTSSVLTELLSQLNQEQFINANSENPTVSLEELLRQLSMPDSSAQNDNAAVSSTQTQLPNNSPTMSVQQGIALAQGTDIVLYGTDRRPPENHGMNGDVAHTVLSDLNAVYHYEGDGLLGVTSHFGHALFDWLQSHPFANFRKESDKEAMRAFAQKLLTRFKGDADFRRDCEALEADFTQEQADYPSNCARACMLIVSLFLHPEAV